MNKNKKKQLKCYSVYTRQLLLRYAMLSGTVMLALCGIIFAFNYWYTTPYTNQAYHQSIVNAATTIYLAYDAEIVNLSCDSSIVDAATGGDGAAAKALLRSALSDQAVGFHYTLVNSDHEIVLTDLYPVNESLFFESIDTIWMFQTLAQTPTQSANSISRAGYSYGQECIYQFGAAILDGADVVGYLVLDLVQRDVDALVQDRPISDMVVVDRYQNIIYTTFPTKLFYTDTDGGVKWNSDWVSRTEVEIEGEAQYCSRTPGDAFGRPDILFYSLTSTKLLLVSAKYAATISCLFALFYLLGAYILANSVSKRSLKPLQELVSSIESWDESDYLSNVLPPQEYDEYQSICNSFNAMIAQTNDLLETNKQLNDSNYQMELRNIQALFNPHFVFNMMETIRSMALKDANAASDTIVSFSRILRYSLNYGQPMVTLSTDLKYIEDYLKLQKLRLGNRLLYSISVTPLANDMEIPKLFLQPLVENAIIHNAEQVQQIRLEIIGRLTQEELRLCVIDNGVGIPPEVVAQVQAQSPIQSSIGLGYVDRILQLHYGYGLELEALSDGGTKVTIRIPRKDCL